MMAVALTSERITNALFLLEGVEWLKWLVGSFFFLLGVFAGWWRWGYRREVQAAPAGAGQGKPDRILSAPAEPEDPFGPVYDSAPDETDDLTRIRGIGAALATRLNALGIYRFDQIGGWTEGQAEAIAKRLSLGNQILKNEWIGQAKQLQEDMDGVKEGKNLRV